MFYASKFQDRIPVWEDTQKVSKEKYNEIPESEKHNVIYHPIKKIYDTTYVRVLPMDTIDAAFYAIEHFEAISPVVLNMADNTKPGGNVHLASGAQEENLFRRSNYFLTLKKEFYPISDNSVIYSPDVTVFKSGEDTENPENCYNYIEPRKLCFIASASVSYPNSDGKVFLNEKDYNLQCTKIETIFQTCMIKKHDTLILSAYGCGAFVCPAEAVAKIFKEKLKKYNGVFKNVIFAIHDPKGENIKIFKNILRN